MGESLKRIHGIHAGRPAAIMGTGPSLRHLKAEDLDGFVTFTINAAILKYPMADYFVSCDGTTTVWLHWDCLGTTNATAFIHGVGGFKPTDFERIRLPRERQFWYGRFDDRHEAKALGFEPRGIDGMRMRRDDVVTIQGVDSTQVALHIAYVMGCDPIVLLGVDCQWEDGKYRFTDFPTQPEDWIVRPDSPHARHGIVPRVPAGGPYAMDGYQSRARNFWQRLREQNPHANIVNASGGCLDVFPRIGMVDLQKLRTEQGEVTDARTSTKP